MKEILCIKKNFTKAILLWAIPLLLFPLWAQPSLDDKAEDKALEEELREIEKKSKKEQASDAASEGASEESAGALDLAATRLGNAQLRLIDISLDALFAGGGSNKSDSELQNLQVGGHDPRKRGFTVQNVELSFMGAVDPYLNGEAHLVYFIDPLTGESQTELEEAFLTTQSLPYGLQVEAGQFFTEFGRINPRHPHQWNWSDQPVINSRLFGPDGMRGAGLRVGYLAPLPWYSEFHAGLQNANGPTMASFLASESYLQERAIGGRSTQNREAKSSQDMVYLGRWVNSVDLGQTLTAVLGFSGLLGPNPSGPVGRTKIYGIDFLLKWRPVNSFRGWPFFIWQTEAMRRDYIIDRHTSPQDEQYAQEVLSGIKPLPSDKDSIKRLIRVRNREETLHDWGFYSQILVGWERGWSFGIRYEYASGSGESTMGNDTEARDKDPFRDTRFRVSPVIIYQPSEYSRFRLQYNRDRADHLKLKESLLVDASGGKLISNQSDLSYPVNLTSPVPVKILVRKRNRDAWSVWLGAEFLFGKHPAHNF